MGLKQEWVLGMCDRDVPKGVSNITNGIQQWKELGNGSTASVWEGDIEEWLLNLDGEYDFKASYDDRIRRFEKTALPFEDAVKEFNQYVIDTVGKWPETGITISMDW